MLTGFAYSKRVPANQSSLRGWRRCLTGKAEAAARRVRDVPCTCHPAHTHTEKVTSHLWACGAEDHNESWILLKNFSYPCSCVLLA